MATTPSAGSTAGNAFDMALLIPYFILLIVLAFYGVHRYQLVWMYYHTRRTRPPTLRALH